MKRSFVVKAVAAIALTAPIAGPLAAVALASGSNSASPSASTSACPSGTTAKAGGSYAQDKDHLTPVRLSGSNLCYAGIQVKGNFSSTDTWWDLKQCCNGAAITVDNGSVVLAGPRTDNIAVDGFRTWNGATTTINDGWSTDTRDDCISDITHGDLYINNSLFDGCHTGISWRSSNNNNKQAFTVNVQNSLFYIKPMADHGSGGNCKEWVVNGKDNGTMWKMDSVQSGVNVRNVVIRMDLANYQCVDKWPSGTYQNVTLVWNNSKAYPGKLPAGVTMTRDLSVWTNAKNDWIAQHSGGTTPPPAPSPSQSPSQNPSPAPSPSPSDSPTPSPSTSPTGNPVPGAGSGSGGDAPSTCPSRTVTMGSGASYSDGASSTTYDGRGRTYTETQSNLTPVVLSGSNNCLNGVTVNSSIDRTIKWWQMKQCCNGAGVTLNGSAYLQNVRIDNAGVDGIRIWNSSGITMNGVYESYTRDDCISDITHGDLVIRDSLFDGCHTGISWRSDNSANKNKFVVDIQDSMFYVEPEPGSTSGGSCTQYVVNGKANGPMWKMDSVQSGVNLKNVIIRQDLGNHECKDLWPSGTYDNVTFVWTGSGSYPGTLPAGVKLTRDVSVWDNAKSAWLTRHGY